MMLDYLDLLEVLALLAVIFAALDALLIAAFWIWLARRLSAPRHRVPKPITTGVHIPQNPSAVTD